MQDRDSEQWDNYFGLFIDTDSEIEEIPPSEQQCDIREQGMLLFKLQKQRLQEAVHEDTKRTKTLCLLEEIATDPTLSPSKKAVFAETMREVRQVC